MIEAGSHLAGPVPAALHGSDYSVDPAWTRQSSIWLGIFALGQFADWLTSRLGIHHGTHEANRIVRPWLHHGHFWKVKLLEVAVMAALLIIIAIRLRRDNRAARFVRAVYLRSLQIVTWAATLVALLNLVMLVLYMTVERR